jgi:hypothetical protein
MPDPFKPASHPRHPSQTRQVPDLDREAREAEIVAEHEEYVDDLKATHLTAAELADDTLTDIDLTELELRRDALVDYLQRRDTDPAAELPVIMDRTGIEHRLEVNEDGSAASWVPVAPAEGGEADSGQQSPGNEASDDDLAAALAELDQATGRK